MVRPNRIKSYRYNVGSIVADASGNMDLYTDYPLNGLIQSIQLLSTNFTDTGSLILTISGTGEQVWGLTSGTALNNVATADVVFPRATTRGTNNSDQSGLSYAEIPINSVLRLMGSGLGNVTSGTGFNLQYI